MTRNRIRPTRRHVLRAVAAVLTASGMVALAGCSGGGGSGGGDGKIDGAITVQTWALTPTYADYLNGVVDAFEKAHPGTSVRLIDQPGEGYAEKVLSQASSNTLPDVINLPPDIALPLAQRGLLADVSKADASLAKTYVAGGVDSYRYRGVDGVYGYPWYLNTDIDYWNADQMDRCGLDSKDVPTTVDELFQQAAVMHDHCKDTYLMSRKPGLGDFTLAGVQTMNADGTEFTFATQQAADLIERYAQAYQGGLMPSSVLNSDYLGNSTLFTQQKVAWTTGGATALADFEKNNPSLKGEIVVSPALDTPPLYVQGLSVSAKSKNPATAEAFAQFMTDAENQNAFARIVNIFPSTVSSQSDAYFSKDDGTQGSKARVLASKSLSEAKNLNPPQANSAMTTFLDQQIALAMRGSTTPMQALQTAQTRMNQLLKG